MRGRSPAEQVSILSERCVDVIAAGELERRLAQRPALRVKLGIDPSGPLLHLGHAVVLRKLREFQDLGHQAILVVGDFTARIGDPTGRPDSRKPREPAQIASDMASYAAQAALILDMDRAQVRYNGEWLGKLDFADVIRLSAKVTVARMLERDDFTKRHLAGVPIGLHEFMYPLAQAYDSLFLESDVELGGTEQLFNLLMGRRLQEEHAQAPQICMTLPILEGTDGIQRMGKSLDNYVALRDDAPSMFGKIMSLPDHLLERYWRLASGVTAARCDSVLADLAAQRLSPRDAKLALAQEIVSLYHGRDAGAAAAENFRKTVVRKEMPETIPEFSLGSGVDGAAITKVIVELGWAKSAREAQRLVQQGAVKIDGARCEDIRRTEASWIGKVIQKGNHQYARIGRRP
ncbi:MAG: tyrosine--tRNA ligase [Candidatus Eremiobacteraeota bacterium]|nr:tyrosine--tRNA ligase [Candidatus Eremiobacteraeota bacterium]MBC5827851.1 tyrosine--tRNA ligase [Candidatus Eremiobacteraeota bacterium]